MALPHEYPATESPMPLPRFRLRTLMIAVAVVALVSAILVQRERHRRSRDTVFRFANATAAPVDFARVTYSGGVVGVGHIMPGKVIEWRTPISVGETMIVQIAKDGSGVPHYATPSGGVTVFTFRTPKDQLDSVSGRLRGRYNYVDVPVR